MKTVTLTPESDFQLKEWIHKLQAAGAFFEQVTVDGKPAIQLSQENAINVLQKLPPWSLGVKILAGFTGFIILMFIISMIVVATHKPEPLPQKDPGEMNQSELTDYYQEKYGYYTEWGYKYRDFVKNNYVNYPKTFKGLETRIIPIDQDSFTHVLMFEAKNAFGVPSDHVITTVMSKDGEVQRVVSQH